MPASDSPLPPLSDARACMSAIRILKQSLRSDALGLLAGATAGAVGLSALLLAAPSRTADSAMDALVVFGIIFGGTMSLYNADRWTDRDIDVDTPERRAIWAQSQGLAPWLILAPYGVSMALLALFSRPGHVAAALLIYATLGILGFGYSVRTSVISKKLHVFGFQRAKDVPLLKCFYVPLMWAVTATIVPPMVGTSLLQPALLAFGIYIFMRMFVGCTASDFRDIESDSAAGIVTLPVALGAKQTIHIMQVINVASICWLLLAAIAGWLPVYAWTLMLSNLQTCIAWHQLSCSRSDVRRVLIKSFVETASMPALIGLPWLARWMLNA